MREWKDGLYCEITPWCYTISVKKKGSNFEFWIKPSFGLFSKHVRCAWKSFAAGTSLECARVPMLFTKSKLFSTSFHGNYQTIMRANNWLHVMKTPNSKHVSFVLVVSQTCNHAPKLTAQPWLHSSFLKLKSFSETCKDLDQLEKRHVQISCWSLPSISSWRNHWSRKNLEKDAQQCSQEMTTRFLRTLDRACLNRKTFVTEPWIYPAA